jgi:hypothetical protein
MPTNQLCIIVTRGRRVLGVLSMQISLITANAYISTLGGGHFLCKHLDSATAMAMRQHKVATNLGDPLLAAQCRIHLM